MALNYSFAGKKVLVTGGGHGIGRQLVQRFHDDGATVYTVDKNPEFIRKLQEEVPNVTAIVVDISDWKATRKVIESFGPIDHLVNNAGIFEPAQQFMDITEEAFHAMYGVNVGAVINVTQTVARGMIKGSNGSIVNISSLGAHKHLPTMACYCSSKAALEMLTKSMAIELGSHNIRVNCIVPGKVDVPLPNSMLEDQNFSTFISQIKDKLVIKRLIDRNEIADLVLFLLSPLSSMVVGEAVTIDGGMALL